MDNSGKSALGLDTNVAAGLAYLPICAINLIMSIIIIATDKTNKLARFSAFQSLLLFGVAIVGYIALMILGFVAAAANSSILAMLIGLLYLVYALGVLIALIWCCIQAFMGKMVKLPIIGGMADNWSN